MFVLPAWHRSKKCQHNGWKLVQCRKYINCTDYRVPCPLDIMFLIKFNFPCTLNSKKCNICVSLLTINSL